MLFNFIDIQYPLFKSGDFNGSDTIKMVMIGGHDITVDQFMNFLDGMKIIPRTHYPHFACNVVIELRKYNDDFYLEFYYNDILRYNNTLKIFKNSFKESKYSYLYNYWGIPSWITPPVTIEEKQSENIQNETNVNENKNNSNLNNITPAKWNEFKRNKNEENITQPNDFNIMNETIILNDISQQIDLMNETKILTNISQQNEINSNEIMNEEKITEQNNFNITNGTIDLNNNRTYKTSINLKVKLKQFLRQDSDLNLFIILGCSVFFILLIIILIISFWIIKKRRKIFTKLVEEKSGNNNPSVISIPDSKNKWIFNNKFNLFIKNK